MKRRVGQRIRRIKKSQQGKRRKRVVVQCLVDQETRSALDRMAKWRGWTRSQLLREAIRTFLSTHSSFPESPVSLRGEEGPWLTLERF